MPDLDIRETARQAALSEYSHAKVRDRRGLRTVVHDTEHGSGRGPGTYRRAQEWLVGAARLGRH